jgi:hypothetical protein
MLTTQGCKSTQSATPVETSQQTPPETKPEPTMPKGRLLTVEYDYQGMAMEIISKTKLSRIDNVPKLTFMYLGEEMSCEVGDSLFDQARDIIEQERMYAYESSYSLDPSLGRILDGDRWEFYATFEGKERIYSYGRNVSPKGDGLHRISKLLRDAAKQYVDKLDNKNN